MPRFPDRKAEFCREKLTPKLTQPKRSSASRARAMSAVIRSTARRSKSPSIKGPDHPQAADLTARLGSAIATAMLSAWTARPKYRRLTDIDRLLRV